MNNKICEWKFIENRLEMCTQLLNISLYFVDEKVFRLQCTKRTDEFTGDTPIIDLQPEPVAVRFYERDGELLLCSESITARIGVLDFSIRVQTKDGRELFKSADERALETKTGMTIFRLHYGADERIYGLGQDPMARLDHRDNERRMWNRTDRRRRSGNNGIPFYSSSAGYGLFLNSYLPARFAVGRAYTPEAPELRTGPDGNDPNPDPWPYNQKNPESHPDEISVIHDHDGLDLFFLCMEQLDDIQSKYCELTGHAILLPRWAFGLIQSKNRYRSMQELIMIVKRYREKGIPLDCLVIDWLWFKEFGDLAWDEEYWPEPEKGIKELGELGIRVMQAQHPFIDRPSLKYPEMLEKGYLSRVPENYRPTYDFTNPEASEYWWNNIAAPLYRTGIRAYWTDMSEPEDDHPQTGYFIGGRDRAHNQYALLWSRALYEGQRRDFSERVFTLSRGLSAGIQRYGTAHWSNDIEASWEVLRDQVVIGQGVALSGQLYWCTDIGGFMTLGNFSPELYIRWIQWGVFCTLFRTHGTRADNEPWSFGEEAEKIISETIRLRYRLMPYIYSCIRQATLDGKPVVRAMALDFPNDDTACAQTDQYMFGPSILVAPVVEHGERSRKLYLPEGLWYDFWEGVAYGGGRFIMVPAPLERIPLFVRAGSIIPTIDHPVQNSMEVPCDILLKAYPGKKGEFLLYEDDGISYSYENGQYVLTRIEMDNEGKISTEVLHHAPGIVPENRKYSVELPSIPSEGNPEIFVDSDLAGNGILNAYLTIVGHGNATQKASASIKIPQGWEGRMKVKEAVLDDFCVLHAVLRPVSDCLPVRFHSEFQLKLICSGREKIMRIPFSYGSGFATRFQLMGDFENKAGIHTITPVEEDQELLFYEAESRMFWNRRYEDEFNSMGYVYCWRKKIEEGPRPVSYARCVVLSDNEREAYIECSGDNSLMLWVNKELVFSSSSIVYRQVLPNPIRLKEGENLILIKVAQNHPKPYSGRELGFSFRLVDRSGKPMEDLLYIPK